MADIFDEIDEELKQDRAKQVWARYGKYVIAAAAAKLQEVIELDGTPPELRQRAAQLAEVLKS